MIDLDDLAAKLRGGDPHTVLMFLFGMSGVLTFPLLFFVSAPYGKLYREVRGLSYAKQLAVASPCRAVDTSSSPNI